MRTIYLYERMLDRLEGRPTARAKKRDVRHTIIYKAGDRPPWQAEFLGHPSPV